MSGESPTPRANSTRDLRTEYERLRDELRMRVVGMGAFASSAELDAFVARLIAALEDVVSGWTKGDDIAGPMHRAMAALSREGDKEGT